MNDRFRPFSLALACLLWIIATPICEAQSQPDSGPTKASKYSSFAGYTIVKPAGWTGVANRIHGTDLVMLAQSNNNNHPSINVIVKKADPNATLPVIKQQIKTALSSIGAAIKMSSVTDTTVAGEPAICVTSNFNSGNPPKVLYTEEYIVTHGGMLYQFTYASLLSGYRDRYADFQSVMRSIHWSAVVQRPAPKVGNPT